MEKTILIVSLNSIIKRIGAGLSEVAKSLTVARRLTEPCNFKAIRSSNVREAGKTVPSVFPNINFPLTNVGFFLIIYTFKLT